ncbi:MAG TPA: hypothetical protein VF807_00640 [Ktedonobacterales bacterium]
MLEDPEEEAVLPVLGAISAFLRWLEELIVLLSGPLLMVGLGIGLVALLSDGAVLVSSPWLLYVWAVSQTIGVDGQLVGAWYRVSVAVSRGRWGVAVAFGVLGLVLAYVGYVAALTFATQQAYHLTTAQALAKQGMDATSWLWQRAAVSVLLVCLSGYLRYRAPRQSQRSLDERKQAIRDQMELAQLKRQQRAQQTHGAIGLLRGMVAGARGPQHDGDSLQAIESYGEAEAASPLSSRSPQPQIALALPMAWPRVSTSAPSDDPALGNHHRPRARSR